MKPWRAACCAHARRKFHELWANYGSQIGELQVRRLDLVVDAADHQAFLAPVELERVAKLELQWHEGVGQDRLALILAPCPDEVCQPAVATVVAAGLQLREQGPGTATLVSGPVCIGLQRLRERRNIRRQLG